jgi:hypothetical protein
MIQRNFWFVAMKVHLQSVGLHRSVENDAITESSAFRQECNLQQSRAHPCGMRRIILRFMLSTERRIPTGCKPKISVESLRFAKSNQKSMIPVVYASGRY